MTILAKRTDMRTGYPDEQLRTLNILLNLLKPSGNFTYHKV
jgi:hypothetical protein